jgi:hypothetical protein
MDVTGIWFAVPLIALPLLFLPAVWRSRGPDRLFGFICAGAAMALGFVKILVRTGRMEEGPAYWTLDIALSTLFFVMLLLAMSLGRKRQKNAAS